MAAVEIPQQQIRQAAQAAEPRPTVIVDELHIVYRVHGAGTGKGSASSALNRIVNRKIGPTMREIHAVKGVSFEAAEGDSIGVVGRNGSGKSTLLAAIAGLLPPETGKVYTHGQPTLLGVNAALLRDLTGERNIQLGCLAMGMSKEQALAARDGIVEFSGLKEDFISLPMRTYSSGMSARLRFSIAAAKSHDVLLIDEALATGDVEFQRRSEKRIKELRKDAGTVFLVSHSHGVIRETCNRSIWMHDGVIKMDGATDEVLDAYEGSLK
ncbi:ABC transporter ATP-binding protein [Actinospica robiniae]|uniref:ABC transporter ATP-binding protein n=1 Tax=Actinospica robiniae TaxID=304901 RepID=UPI000429A048|nr:ABC transporter ATP-binding protein [Actinospica robiniae]